MEYFTFGMKKLRITQSYTGTTSHKGHWYKSTNYSDYPIDIAGQDGGKDIYYATVDMKVNRIMGIGSSVTNTIYLETTDVVKTPSGDFKVWIGLTHWDDNDPYIKKLKVGDIVKKGQEICMEGKDGATANHLHLAVGNASKRTANGLIENSNHKWVANGWAYKPEDIMFIDKNFTQVLSLSDITFKEKPADMIGTPVSRDISKNQIEVLVDNLNARNGSSVHAAKLGYIKKGIYNYISKTESDNYIWYQIENKVFIANNGTWCKELIKEVSEIEKLQSENEKLQDRINTLEKEKTLLEIDLNSSESELKEYKEYIATKSDKFYIYLNENERLYYKVIKD